MTRRSRRSSWIPTVLITVGLFHLYFVYTADLTRWKGAGFGMFSTIDSGGSRRLEVRVSCEGRTYSVKARDKQLSHLRTVARNFPSERNLERLVRRARALVWAHPGAVTTDHEERAVRRLFDNADSLSIEQRIGAVGKLPFLYQASTKADRLSAVVVDGIHLRLYRKSYDMESRKVSFSLLRHQSFAGQDAEVVAANTQRLATRN